VNQLRLHEITIKNFRKLKNCSITFRDATFLIGPNNTGKSSLFEAINYLHGAKNVQKDDFSKCYDADQDDCVYEDEIEMVAEYRNLPVEAENWLGFRGRVIKIPNPMPGETDRSIKYKKVWALNRSKPEIYLQEYPRSVSEPYIDCQKVEDLVGEDFSEEFLREHFGSTNFTKNLTASAVQGKLADLPAYWDINPGEDAQWVRNPGGIPGYVLSKLPRVVIIPADSCISELTSVNGALYSILGEL